MIDKKNVSSMIARTGNTKTTVLAGIVCFALGVVAGNAFMSHNANQEIIVERESHQKIIQEHSTLVSENNQLRSDLSDAEQTLTTTNEREQETAQSVTEYQDMSAKLQNENQKLSNDLKQLKKTLEKQEVAVQELTASNEALVERTEIQNEVLETSKVFFQDQLRLQQEVNELHTQRAKLISTLNSLVKECQIYLDGTSWEAKSDSCDRKKVASDRLKKIDESIDAKQAKIVKIDLTTEAIGLQKKSQ
ncbi:hypothetical protein VIN01S_09800 [Vibrio inusitatus NBRC 102082]|uniref:Chromosome segregation ATPase n=1 Tax=Vibrio inusitatus NBRC 102082 TaxID=1219070 RepID=A0A4Y3HSV9_9VIBR|nr:hypothetical protein [Vibrio inusitatus]GEA50176.1 hypothetical protein VIN01S_09800 [Vibrio inusitatus NBRC 102082]